MELIKDIFKKHWPALVFAVFLGCLTASPYVYFMHTPQYAGVTLIGQAAEEHYVARIEEVYSGDILTRNTYLPFKNVPYIMPALGEDIIALLGKALSLSAPDASIFSKFLFPLCASVLLYMLAFAISRSRRMGILAVAAVIMGTDIISAPLSLLNIVHGGNGMWWSRPINPELSGIFLFASLYLIYRAYCEGGKYRWWHPIAIGLLTSAALYISIFISIFLSLLLVAFFIWMLWQKNFTAAKSIFSAGVIAVICDIPFIVNYLNAKTYPGYQNTEIQNGVLTSHAPVLGILVVALLLLPLCALPQRFQKARIFFIACAIALVIGLNQQIVTGFYLQPAHFHWYITKPLVAILLSLYGFWFVERFMPPTFLRNSIYAAAIAVMTVYSFFSQANFYRINKPDALTAQAYAPVITYLNNRPSMTILSNEPPPSERQIGVLADYISMYTTDDTPEEYKYAGLYIAPKDYFKELVLLQYRLRGIAPKDALAVMQQERNTVILHIYNEYWQLDAGTPLAVPNNIIPTLAAQYGVYASHSIPSMMHDLGINELIVDNTLDTWHLPKDPGLTLVTTVANRFLVYAPSTPAK